MLHDQRIVVCRVPRASTYKTNRDNVGGEVDDDVGYRMHIADPFN